MFGRGDWAGGSPTRCAWGYAEAREGLGHSWVWADGGSGDLCERGLGRAHETVEATPPLPGGSSQVSVRRPCIETIY